MNRIALASGVVVEDLGSSVLVFLPGLPQVLTLTGESAEVIRLFHDGAPIQQSKEVEDLIDLGVLSAPVLSRRGFVKVGGIGITAGAALVALPGVAAASSGGPQIVYGKVASSGSESLHPDRGSFSTYIQFFDGSNTSSTGPFSPSFSPTGLEFGPLADLGSPVYELAVFMVYFSNSSDATAVGTSDWELSFTWEGQQYVLVPHPSL